MESKDGETKMKSKEEIEGEIANAMQARVNDFKEQADSLTLEGVRRTLEKDLGMKEFSLDSHKKFIKKLVEQVFEGGDEKTPETSGSTQSKADKSAKEEDSEEIQLSMENKNETSISDSKIKPDEMEKGNDLNEDTIRQALKKRASHFRANLETITLLNVRRLLEEDLKLERKALDSYKGFISKELEEVLKSPEESKSQNGITKTPKKSTQKTEEPKKSKDSKTKRSREETEDSDKDENKSENENKNEEEEEEEEVKPKRKKRAVQKVKAKPKSPKKQKEIIEEKKNTGSKIKKSAKKDLNANSKEGEGGSEDGESHSSSSEEDVKRKRERPAATQVYGKRVEHLKSVIKSCGITIPPTVYRRVKQVQESKREARLIKELEEILEKEGLSTNPSEKEIKAVKKKKERAKELEGIDTSNIITSSRRRSSSLSWIPPPKAPKIDDSDDDDDDDDNDDDDNDDNDENKINDGDGDGDDASDDDDGGNDDGKESD